MKFLSSLVSGLICLCLTFTLHAQIQPKQTYANETNLRSTTPENLFQPLPEGAESSAQVDADIRDYSLLALDREALSQLKATAPEQLYLNLPTTNGLLSIQLIRSQPFAAGFRLRMASGEVDLNPELGVHYRGTVDGQPGTHVAFSLLEGEVQGLIAGPDGNNLVLGPLAGPDRTTDTYILYRDQPVFATQDLDCATEDSGVAYPREVLELPATQRSSTGNCVQVYFEVDYNIYQDKGSNTAAYVGAAFNEVAALYAAINVDLTISEIFVWNQFSPYGGSSSGTLLSQFQNHRPTFNGDVAQLLSYSASGGIAVLSGLCHPISAARMSFSSIGSSFQNVPTYSWTIMVIAHELGHLLGSQHTHACVWNGNGTAIDGCAGFTEGNCGNPGIPQGGGSVMSYCHLTSAGINFNVGFGAQPAAAIFNFINSASCVAGNTCGGNPPPPPPNTEDCDDYVVMLELTLDHFGPETSWVLENENQDVQYSGGPYDKKLGGTTIRDTFCLLEDCYIFRILDEDEDGICCDYGEGDYLLIGPDGEVLAEGATFEDNELTDFCLPEGNNPPTNTDCVDLNFNTYPVISYGVNQDIGQSTVSNGGNQLEIRNNAWKAVELDYLLTEETMLEFDFRSTIQGEIHGIGFDDNLGISPQFTFRVYGTQTWGIGDYDTYSGGGQWTHYTIPVGDFLAGEAAYLFFCSDHDIGARNGNSFFRNVRIYEGSPCSEQLPAPLTATDLPATRAEIFPNPAANNLQLTVPASGSYEIMSATGRLMFSGNIESEGASSKNLDVSGLPAGSYLLRYRHDSGEETLRFSCNR